MVARAMSLGGNGPRPTWARGVVRMTLVARHPKEKAEAHTHIRPDERAAMAGGTASTWVAKTPRGPV
jgi:hypothetical protein